MRIAYFDCIAGISGDSALGALVDAGADTDQLRTHLATLPLEPFELEFEEVDELGVRACSTPPTCPRTRWPSHTASSAGTRKPRRARSGATSRRSRSTS
jgi:hypothetical protein